MAKISNIDRARIILDLLKDDDVSNLTPYNSVDKIPLVTAAKYADSLLVAYPNTWYDESDPPQEREPTNDEVAAYFIKRLKTYLKEIHQSNLINTATEDARTNAAAGAVTEVNTDLGE